ncbi:hypothetical protein B0H14DRAFT_3856951 [Mycena olivaceomarginata]|nr:hypothetical protein B0H14DRAFT_3856951 [Mycena olivaceomarginata]
MSTTSSRAADRAYIAEIDSQIFSLKESIQALEGKKLRAQERLNSYAYPVLTLPNEIVSEIFVQFLPVYPSPPPIIFAADGDKLPYPRTCSGEQSHCRTTTPLTDSKFGWTCPACLPLSIDMEEIWNIVDKSCLELLALHRARWEYVTLAVHNESDVLTMEGSMPLLRQFEIRLEAFSPGLRAISFREAPRLRSATLWDGITRPTDLFPWSQLTSLTLIHRPIVNTEILQLAVNLVHCHLMLWSDEIPSSDVRLPSLESLVLAQMWGIDDWDAVTHYLETMITPSLRTLEVPEAFLQPSPIDTLRLFISKSGCVVYKGSASLGKFAPRPCIATHCPPPFQSFHSTRL